MKPPKKIVEGNDATIKINLFLPDMAPIEHTIKITNLRGRVTNSQRTPNTVLNAIKLGLMSKYGKRLE